MFYPHNLQHWTIVSHHKKVCSTFNYWQCDNSASITRQCNYRYTAMVSCAVIFFKALQIKHGSWWILHTSTIMNQYNRNIGLHGYLLQVFMHTPCILCIQGVNTLMCPSIHSWIAPSTIGFSPDNCLTHLYTQKNCTVNRTETKAAASTGSISTGWPRKHITTIAT